MKLSAPRHPRRSLLVVCLTATVFATCAFAQSKTAPFCTPAPPPGSHPLPLAQPEFPPCPVKHRSETSISFGAFSQLTTTRAQDTPYNATIVQGTAPSAGVLGTFRQTFSPWLGYSVNLGYARLSEHYRGYGVGTDSGAYVDGFNVSTNVYESSVTYVAHTRVNKRYSLFGDIGPGLLTFLPTHRGPDAINYAPFQYASLVPGVQVRPAAFAGSGFDLRLTQHLGFRAEYRGFLYKNPDFQTGDAPYSKLLTLTSEPTVSLVYTFTHPTQ